MHRKATPQRTANGLLLNILKTINRETSNAEEKSFRNVQHPAAVFISSNENTNERHSDVSGGEGLRKNESQAEYHSSGFHHETKSKRLNLLIRPDLMNDFIKIACMRRTSGNDLINRLVEECVIKETSLVLEYDRMFGDDNSG